MEKRKKSTIVENGKKIIIALHHFTLKFRKIIFF